MRKIKCIAIDDEPIALLVIKQFCERKGGMEITTFCDPRIGLEEIKRTKPDLVFLDIVMPKKDGNDAIRDIMKFDPEATIIIASSVGTQSQLKNALEAGAKDFIQKPLDKEQVLAVVKRFLEGR
jgi:two-component system chemotaxis response regulator CheY